MLVDTPTPLHRAGQGTFPRNVPQDIDRTDDDLLHFPTQDITVLSHRTIYRLDRKVYVRRQDLNDLSGVLLVMRVLAPKLLRKQIKDMKYKEAVTPPFTIAVSVHNLRTREYMKSIFIEVLQ